MLPESKGLKVRERQAPDGAPPVADGVATDVTVRGGVLRRATTEPVQHDEEKPLHRYTLCTRGPSPVRIS